MYMHYSWVLTHLQAERVLSFIPPDGPFRLLSYQIGTQRYIHEFWAPLYIYLGPSLIWPLSRLKVVPWYQIGTQRYIHIFGPLSNLAPDSGRLHMTTNVLQATLFSLLLRLWEGCGPQQMVDCALSISINSLPSQLFWNTLYREPQD